MWYSISIKLMGVINMLVNKLTKEQIEKLYDTIEMYARLSAENDYNLRVATHNNILKLIDTIDVVTKFELNLDNLLDTEYIRKRTLTHISKETWRYTFNKFDTYYKHDFVVTVMKDMDKITECGNTILIKHGDLVVNRKRVHNTRLIQVFSVLNKLSRLTLPTHEIDGSELYINVEYNFNNLTFKIDKHSEIMIKVNK